MGDIIKFPINRTWPAIRKQTGFSAIDFVKGDPDLNLVLEMIWPMTTQGKKEIRFNPDF